MNNLVRPDKGALLAGVCAGIANRYNRSVWAIRALFVISTIIPGPQFIIYIVLWALIPKESEVTPSGEI